MWPDRDSNPGHLTYESGALPIALPGSASSLRDLGTQWAVSLRIPERSCKIVETLP